MRPPQWNPPIKLSKKEQKVVKRIRRAKLFIFLRDVRHDLFNEAFQTELGTIFKDSTVGKSPIPPAKLALATILQAYMGVSDDEVIEELEMDRRWQLVLDCLDCEQAPFSKATLVRFRAALIAKGFDRRLIETTVEMAHIQGGFCDSEARRAKRRSLLERCSRFESLVGSC
jgi:hypothetical protein